MSSVTSVTVPGVLEGEQSKHQVQWYLFYCVWVDITLSITTSGSVISPCLEWWNGSSPHQSQWYHHVWSCEMAHHHTRFRDITVSGVVQGSITTPGSVISPGYVISQWSGDMPITTPGYVISLCLEWCKDPSSQQMLFLFIVNMSTL